MRKARMIAMVMAIIMAMNGSITAYATNNGIIETSEAIDVVDVVDDVVNDSIAENDEVDEAAVEEGEDEALGEMPIVSEDVDAETTDEMQEDTNEDLSGEILIETKAEIAYQATAESDFTWVGDKITQYNGSASAVEIPARATAIGNNAFKGNTNIQSLTFESGSKLTEIGSQAFYQCSKLSTIELPASVTSIDSEAFRYTNIADVTIGKNVKNLGYQSFANISETLKIRIEGTGNITVNGMNVGVFADSTVSEIEFANTITKIPSKLFKNIKTSGTLEVILPEKCLEIGASAFQEISGNLQITLNKNLTTIGEYAFCDCGNLKEITLPESLTTIGVGAFKSTGIADVTIGKNVKNLGYQSFANMSETLKIRIEGTGNITVNGMNVGVFADSTVSEIELADTITKIPSKLFKNIKTSETLEVILPEKCLEIGASAFQEISGNLQITLNKNLTTIGEYAFCDCKNLKEITLPESLTAIGVGAFKSTGIADVTIGKKVKNLGYQAFANISETLKIRIEGTGNITVNGMNVGVFADSTVSEIELANTITKIPSKLFIGIKTNSIVSIYIPDSIVSVASDAFSNVDTSNIEVHLTSNANATVAKYFKDKGFRIKQSLSIKYVLNGGTQNPANNSYFESGDMITLAEPTRTGYSFEGWYKTSSFTGSPVTEDTPANSVIYYAKWAIIPYSITYNVNDGTMPSTYAKSYDVTKAVTLPKPTKTGMVFAGWYDNAGFEGNPITTISKGTTENKVYYAKWTGYRYTVTFNFGGGINDAKKTSAKSTIQYADKEYTIAEILANAKTEQPTKAGYAFKGWCTASKESSSTKLYQPGDIYSQAITRDNQALTLYAIWSVIPHNIEYNWNSPASGYEISDSMVTNLSSLPIGFNEHAGVTLKNPKVPGFTFVGWAKGNGEIDKNNPKLTSIKKLTENDDVTLFAHWTENKYTITFNYNGGKAANITNPTKQVSSIKTQYMMFSSKDASTNRISSLTNEPSRQYYTFGGWSLKQNGLSIYSQADIIEASDDKLGGKANNNKANVTLYAVWIPITHNIIYDWNSPVESYAILDNMVTNLDKLPDNYNEYSGVTLKNPIVPGFTFAGWAEKDAVIDRTNPKITKIAKGRGAGTDIDVKLYAHWTENKYTITFNYNGGTVLNDNGKKISSKKTDWISYTSENSFSTLTSEPTKAGSTFVGWTYVKNGEVVFAKEYAELIAGFDLAGKADKNKANVTLYAKWK